MPNQKLSPKMLAFLRYAEAGGAVWGDAYTYHHSTKNAAWYGDLVTVNPAPRPLSLDRKPPATARVRLTAKGRAVLAAQK